MKGQQLLLTHFQEEVSVLVDCSLEKIVRFGDVGEDDVAVSVRSLANLDLGGRYEIELSVVVVDLDWIRVAEVLHNFPAQLSAVKVIFQGRYQVIHLLVEQRGNLFNLRVQLSERFGGNRIQVFHSLLENLKFGWLKKMQDMILGFLIKDFIHGPVVNLI